VLDNALFYDVTDKEILNRIPLEAKGKIKQTSLSEQGINIEPAPPYLWSGSKFTQPYTELMCNNKEQMVARWPNGEHNYAYFNNRYPHRECFAHIQRQIKRRKLKCYIYLAFL
jgi:hypothetical protein